ncbi:hypothetical protein ACSS6W_005572 [Trichoderma asperelloides]|uniref:Uncharacterized protein n=1 Tax=Trichoderma asperellum TaxID=101201 RepID=A0A6V8R6W5_TRIAP|nr:hypothetical protein LI328DRAFT_136030 [Trichoderma asperelloides]GFP58363.1 hypothetical protein TASIC1_0010017400 [Trichoderma asperellum]
MGPPKTRGLEARPSRSRFHEGSMNDRVSAVPPDHFLGPGEIESLERPLEVELEQHQYNLRNARRSQDTQRQLQLWLSQAPSIAPSVAPSTSTSSPSKKGMLGKVWDGVRGRLQLKKDTPSPEQKKKPDSPPKKPATANIYDDRPTREEALASYHLLVESGFFTSHAIQSTRQPPPPGFVKQRPATSHQVLSVSTPPRAPQPLQAPPSLPPPPKFPLNTTPKTPRSTRSNRTSLSAVTPASADSRGTKRTVNDSTNNDILIHQDEREKPEVPREARKKIRKSTSKDFTIPVLHAVKSRRKLTGSRSNRRKSQGNAGLPPVVIHHYHSHSASSRDSKHSKRSSHLLCAASTSSAGSSPRSSLDSTSSWRESGESVYSVRAIGSGSKSSRALRPRKPAAKAGATSTADADATEPLKVVPNANRGIPGVPSIPAKYTFGEDRENGQAWRGLRR